MKLNLFIFFILPLFAIQAFPEDSIPITISSEMFAGDADEWLHLKITDTITNQIWYDSLATVYLIGGFHDTVYLDSGIYKCEILDIGANVGMPEITLDNGYIVPWGYPEYSYYLFHIPGDLNLSITESSSDNFISFYPNPMETELIINLPGFYTIYIDIIDINGEKIKSQMVYNTQIIRLDTIDLKKGIYFIKLYTKQFNKIVKVIKS